MLGETRCQLGKVRKLTQNLLEQAFIDFDNGPDFTVLSTNEWSILLV